MVTTGNVYRRLVKPYRSLPLCLARLVDPLVGETSRVRLATWFSQLKPCCLDKAFSSPLRSMVHTPQDFLEGNKGFDILRAAFACKNTNMTVENAFARAASMRAATRGRNDQTHNLWAKHILAETKSAHRRCLANDHRKTSLLRCNTHEPIEHAQEEPSASTKNDGQGAVPVYIACYLCLFCLFKFGLCVYSCMRIKTSDIYWKSNL